MAQAWSQACTHGDLPLERLIEALQPSGDVMHSPLFQVQLVLEAARDDVAAGGLHWRAMAVETGLAAFDLTLRARPSGPDLELEAEYSTELFARETIERLLTHLQRLIAGAAAEPERGVWTLTLLADTEREQLINGWNATAVAYPREQCLHELVERQAERTPRTVAVTASDGQLSYRELDERANALARHLRGLGVGPEVRVAVAAERTATTIVALLAILKAGGAYVPLDLDSPSERLGFILRDAGIEVVVARAAIIERLGLAGARLVDPTASLEAARQPPTSGVGADNLAYVIYTSGSMGRPKGVLVPHRQIVNSTLARSNFDRFAPRAYAVPVPLSFDASAAGIYWTLSTGGRLVLPDDDQVQDPRLLARLIEDEHVTHVTGMPWFYHILLTAGTEALKTLRDISIGGEVMPPHLPCQHYAVIPWARLYNDYGPTEATVWSTAHLCQAEDEPRTVPIGRPIQNARIYVLDRRLEPQPVGVAGELYIAGDGLARGYLNAPRLTAERFIPNPFALTPGERLYGTGDLARYLTNGELEFLGRADAQVKIRGFRVELGEIEASLQAHPAVATAVVTAHDERPGDTRLNAYVVPRPGCALQEADLIAFLAQKLPTYMMPVRIVFVDDSPQTPQGKLDRRRLTSSDCSQQRRNGIVTRAATTDIYAGYLAVPAAPVCLRTHRRPGEGRGVGSTDGV